MTTTTTEAPASTAGLLGNGSQFIMPMFTNMPWFGYAGLADQMKDASGYYKDGKWVPSGWSSGAGKFAGNNIPKFNGLPGSDPNGTFAGGFANMPANVGGAQYGKQAYSGGFDPFRGRGLLPPGGGGGPGAPTTPGPTTPGTTPYPPGAHQDPTRGQPGGTAPGAGVGGITNPGLLNGSTPNNTSTVGSGVGGITGLLGGGGTPPPKSGMAGMGGAGQAPYPNNWEVPQNNQTIKTASGKDVPNPFGLTQEQIYFALSGHPDAIARLRASVPNEQTFHQIVNYYASGGGAFNTGYTPEDAFNAQKSYSLGLGEKTFAPMQQSAGLPMFASMEEARKAGYV